MLFIGSALVLVYVAKVCDPFPLPTLNPCAVEMASHKKKRTMGAKIVHWMNFAHHLSKLLFVFGNTHIIHANGRRTARMAIYT